MRPDFFRDQNAGADNMGDDQQSHIGRRVVRAMASEIFAADLAGVDDFEIGAEQAAPSTGRTAPHESARHRFDQRAVWRRRWHTPNTGHVVHRRLPLYTDL